MGKIKVLEVIQIGSIGEDIRRGDNAHLSQIIGGAEMVLLNILKHIDPKKFECRALIVGEGGLVERLQAAGFPLETFIFEKSYNRDLIRVMRRIIKKHDIDIVHTHMSRMNIYGVLAAFGTRAANVMTIHGLLEYSTRRARIYYSLFGSVSSRIVTVSGVLADHFISKTFIGRRKITIIPNGVDLAKFDKKIDRDESRKRFGIPLEARVILAVGNIRPIKGYELLIESFEKMAQQDDQLHLVICGYSGTDYGVKLRKEVADKPFSSRIRFTNFIEDIEVLYRLADIYVLSSVSEGFSLTTVEAMASSLPVVTTDCIGPREIIDNGIDGIVVEKRDPDLFGEAILQLLNDKELSRSMGAAARKKVEQRYSINKSIEKFQELFSTLAKKN